MLNLFNALTKGIGAVFGFIIIIFFLFLGYMAIHNLFMKQIFIQYNNFPCQNQTISTNEPKSIYKMDGDYSLESFNDITRNWLLDSAPATKAKQIKYYPRGSTMKIIGMYGARNKGQMFTDQSSSSYLLETNDTHEKVWFATYQVDTSECKMVDYTRNKQSTNKDYNITSTIVKTTSAISLMFK